jgi:hypothetical protein
MIVLGVRRSYGSLTVRVESLSATSMKYVLRKVGNCQSQTQGTSYDSSKVETPI